MTGFTVCLLVLMTGGLLPALILTAVGDAPARLVGLVIGSSVITFILILMSQVGPGQSYDLILPLVLVPLSLAGTLVFTRLLGRGPG